MESISSFLIKGLKVMALVLVAALILTSMAFTNTVQASSGTVTTYVMPGNLPATYVSSDFSVTAGGQTVPIYNAGLNAWNNAVSYGSFDFTGGAVSVSIAVNSSFGTFKLAPSSLGITGTRSGNIITFSVAAPTNINLVLDGNYQGKVLHLFAQGLETNIPSQTDPNVIYYSPGYYDLSNQAPISIASGKTLYIAGGAVIRGRFLVKNASNVTIRGRGIILNDYLSNDNYDSVPLVIKRSSWVTIDDIIINRGVGSWTAFMQGCNNINVTDYKVVSPAYASTDGFNICNSHDITFDKAFIHSCDDAVAIKGSPDTGYTQNADPSSLDPNYNITYQNSQLWSDANNAIEIGAETEADYFDTITFRNIDILYNFDDKSNPDVLTERSAINICALNGTTISNITFDNIRVEKAKRLINIDMRDTYWFGSILGNWDWPGSITDITYNNITSTSDGSNEIRIAGWDMYHQVGNVHFNNIKINGTYVTNFSDPHFKINQFSNYLGLTSPGGGTTSLIQGPAGIGTRYNASTGFSTTQGGNHWYYRRWTAGAGMSNMTWNPDGSNHWRGPNTYDAIWNGNGCIYLHPDNGQSMIEWQAPASGTITVTGTVKKGDTGGGDGVNVSIWKNNTMIWPYNGTWKTIGYNNSSGYSHNFSTAVIAGDTISFRVDSGSNISYDTTSWSPEIYYGN